MALWDIARTPVMRRRLALVRGKPVKSRTGNQLHRANTGRARSSKRSRPHIKPKITRDWSLLVSDQDILDLVSTCNAHTLYALASRFVAILDAIKNNDLRALDRIARESRAPKFRTVVAAIKNGLAEREPWSARYTARAVIAESFRHTPAYFRALDAFTATLRGKRLGRAASRRTKRRRFRK
jgi:hypothetical protein